MPDPVADLPTAYRLLVADVYDVAGRSRRTSEALARAEGQSTARWHLMSVISDGPQSVAGAARRLGLARQSVQRVADQLLADGLAEASPDPADARAPRLALTPAGRRQLRAETDRLTRYADVLVRLLHARTADGGARA